MSMVLFNSVEVKHSSSFGRGVLPFVGQYDGVQPYTQADLEAAAQLFGELESAGRPALRVPEGVCKSYGFEMERAAALELSEMGVRRYEAAVNGSGSLCQCGEIGRTCDACMDEAYESYRLERRAEFLPSWDDPRDDDYGDAVERRARKEMEEEGRGSCDPSDEDELAAAWDSEPDFHEMDNRASEQELAEMGVSGPNRGFAALSDFGHDCTAERPSASEITFEKLVAAYQDERRGPKGRKVSLKAARQGVRDLQAMGMLPWVLPVPKTAAR
jgi:hypothetical protein